MLLTATVDTSGTGTSPQLAISRPDEVPVDSSDYFGLKEIILPEVKKGAVWEPGTNFFGRKVKTWGVFWVRDEVLFP